MQLIYIYLIPAVGLLLTFLLSRFVSFKKFQASDILPIFFLVGIQLLTNYHDLPSFLPYGFLAFFILVIIYSIYIVWRDRNISITDTLLNLWRYLIVISAGWLAILSILLFL